MPRHIREIFAPLLLAFKCMPHSKYEKKAIEMPVSLFFHNIVPNLAKFCTKKTKPTFLFLLISYEIC